MDSIKILSCRTTVKHGDKVHPLLGFNITKCMGLVVVKSPLTTENCVLEGGVGTRIIGYCEYGCVVRKGCRIGPNPLAHSEISNPIIDINFDVIVHAIVPQTSTIGACPPIGSVHVVQGQIRPIGYRIVRLCTNTLIKIPCMN